jgi:histidinol-phosphate aminotransferase
MGCGFRRSEAAAHEFAANLVFFHADRPQLELATQLRGGGIEIGRSFPPLTNAARITIGLPDENRSVQWALRNIFKPT